MTTSMTDRRYNSNELGSPLLRRGRLPQAPLRSSGVITHLAALRAVSGVEFAPSERRSAAFEHRNVLMAPSSSDNRRLKEVCLTLTMLDRNTTPLYNPHRTR